MTNQIMSQGRSHQQKEEAYGEVRETIPSGIGIKNYPFSKYDHWITESS